MQPIDSKVNEEIKLWEQETVSPAKKSEEEENPKDKELLVQSTPLSKSEGKAERKQTEPPMAEVTKIDDVPVVDNPVEDTMVVEKGSIPDSHAQSVPKPVADTGNSELAAQPAIELVTKEVEEQPVMASVEKVHQEEPKVVDVPESSDGTVEKQEEPSEVLPIKDSEAIVVKEIEDSALFKEVDKPESAAPEVQVIPEQQYEVAKQVEKTKSDEAIETPLEPSEVLTIKSDAVDVKDIEDSEAVSKEVDGTKSATIEVKPKEQSQLTEQVEKPGQKSVESIEKTQEPVEVLAIKQPEAPTVKNINDSEAVSKELDKPESVVPEVEVKLEEQFEVTQQVAKPESVFLEVKVKPEEQSEITRQFANPELVVPEVEVKPEGQSEVTKQVENTSIDEKLEPVKADVEEKPVGQTTGTGQAEFKCEEAEPKGITEDETVKDEGTLPDKVEGTTFSKEKETSKEEKPKCEEVEPKGSTKVETAKDEGALADKVEGIPFIKEEETNKEEKPSADVLTNQKALADLKKDKGESSLPDVTEKVGAEDVKKETNGTDVVEVSSKEVVVEMEKVGEEKEVKTIETEGEIVGRQTLNEELAQPIKMEDVNNAVSSATEPEKLLEKEKSEGIDAVEDSEKEQNIKLEIPALVETNKDGDVAGKLDETTTAVSEPIEESQDSGLGEKEEKSEKTNEDKLEIEKVEKHDVQNLDSSSKEGGDTKIFQDLPREVPAKPTQKQSNNILTKVKQSLVKAKKAIIGKSPSSKTLSSDTKGDIKVK